MSTGPVYVGVGVAEGAGLVLGIDEEVGMGVGTGDGVGIALSDGEAVGDDEGETLGVFDVPREIPLPQAS